MFEERDLTNDINAIESRLRSVQPAPPRLDRDHLMFLAGKHTVITSRRSRLWPALTAVSWMACAVIVGVLTLRPPQVVVETRVVERVVEMPRAPDPTTPIATPPSRIIADSSQTPFENGPVSGENDFLFLEDLRSPLTVLASRPSLYQRVTEPIAVASVEPTDSVQVPVGAKTYSELRRELLGDQLDRNAPAKTLWWF